MEYPKYLFRGTIQYEHSYGNGKYFTFSKAYASEFGNVNMYSLDYTGLNILDLREHDVKDWVNIVSFNRDLDLRNDFKEFIIDQYDVIIGYRSDNSNLVALNKFIKGYIDSAELKRILTLDNRNINVCLKSERALNQITFCKVLNKDGLPKPDDFKIRKKMRLKKDYTFELTNLLAGYFACSLEQGRSYDDAYNLLVDSGIYQRLVGSHIAGLTGSEVYKMCTGKYYKNFKIDIYDYQLANLLSHYILGDGCKFTDFRNKGISMNDLFQEIQK